jgi:polysaccharide pyruvyl transferase WcaK-like protein
MAERYLKASNLQGRPRQRNVLITLIRRVLLRIPKELLETIRALKTLRGTDALVVPGTGFLTDASTGPFGWPYEIFKWSLMARLCGCKLLYVSVGAGPIYRRLSRWLIKSALSLADFRSYRDSSTRDYLEGIGFPTKSDRVYPDLAFSLPEAVIPRGGNHTRKRTVVGIGLMTYAGEMSRGKPDDAVYQDYLQKLLIFVRWLLAHEYDVRLLIGDLLYDGSVKRDFTNLLKKHESMFGEDQGRIIDEPIVSVEHLLSQLAATDIVVATRFHNVLLALILNKPVISIAFHHKCVSLMNDMRLPQYCLDIHDFDVEQLIGRFSDLVKRQEELRPMIQQRAAEFRRALDEQYAVIFNDGFSG